MSRHKIQQLLSLLSSFNRWAGSALANSGLPLPVDRPPIFLTEGLGQTFQTGPRSYRRSSTGIRSHSLPTGVGVCIMPDMKFFHLVLAAFAICTVLAVVRPASACPACQDAGIK